MKIVNVMAVEVEPPLLLAVTETVAERVAEVGVPDISPVTSFKINPLGSASAITV